MTKAVDILPGASTPFEEATLTMLDSHGRYADRLAAVAHLGEDIDAIPDDWLPWFIFNEGLDILLPYLPPREVLREGRPWLKELGSEAAILRALSWLGQAGVKVHYEPDADEHFDLFQVELQAPVSSLTEAARIAELIVLSKASTDILGRVKSGLDGDAFRLDHSLLNGPDLLDDWVGIRIPGLGPETPDGPITWSFGDRRMIRTWGGASAIRIHMHSATCAVVRPFDGFVLDGSALDDERLEPAGIVVRFITGSTMAVAVDNRRAPHPHHSHPGYPPVDFAPTCSVKMTRKETPDGA